jgi:hypothetical protein
MTKILLLERENIDIIHPMKYSPNKTAKLPERKRIK